MVFTPFTVDLLSTPGQAVINGLIPTKNYNITALAKNALGNSAVSNTLNVTMGPQLSMTTPTIIQSNRVRMNQDNSTSKIVSLSSTPTVGNKLFVFVNAFGANNDNNGITGPASATLLGGPFYDGSAPSEVLYIFLIQGDTSNSYRFTGYDGTSNVGFKIVEVANAASWDIQHTVATEAATGTTSISWPVTAPAFSNCIRLSDVSIQYAPATIGAATNCTILQADVIGDTYHTGFLALLNSATVTAPSVALTGAQGTGVDTPAQVSINIYGATVPSSVQNVKAVATTSNSIRVTWDALTPTPTAYIPTINGGAFGTFTRFNPPLSPSVQTYTFTGLSSNTAYQIQIFGDSASGEGFPSTTLNVTTPGVNSLTYIQSCLGTDQTSTGTVTANFTTPTTPGNTLLYYICMFGGSGAPATQNLALGPQPAGSASHVYGPASDGNTDNLQLFYTVPVTSAITQVSYSGYADRASIIVVEVQGIVSYDTITHAGNLTYTDGVNGNVQVPITSASTLPAIGLYFVHMNIPPDSWGTPGATGITKLQAQVGNSSVNNTFHGAALFGDGIVSGVHATAGAKSFPYSIGSGTSSGTGTFSVSGGHIIGPNGNSFIAKGMNVYDFATSQVSTSSAGNPLLTLFPGCNFIRLVCHTMTDPPSVYATFISQMTALQIVVLCEHHIGAGGGQTAPLTGSDLTQENAWFAAMANANKTNPYVWFGTLNEPGGPGSGISTNQQSNYNAIRGTGATNMVAFQTFGDYPDGLHYTVGAGHGLTSSVYASMTNVIWDQHIYNGLPHFNASDGSGSYSTSQSALNTMVAGYISQAQTITSADGVMPVIIGEYGISTDDVNLDPGGTQTCIAVQQSGVGSSAWNWQSGGTYDSLTNGSSKTSYGIQVASFIATGVTGGVAGGGSSSVTQFTPPNYIGVNLLGTGTQTTAPGQVGTETFGTVTSTTAVVNYPAATGTVTGYVTQYGTAFAGPFKSMNSTTSLSVTAGGASDPNGALTPGVTYYFITTAYNGTTPGTPSAVQSTTTVAVSGTAKMVNVTGKLYTFGGKLAQTP